MTDRSSTAERRPDDPMERLIYDALLQAGIDFAQEPDTEHGLDFHIWSPGVAIEVKQFHSPRIAEQMARTPAVIAMQGKAAVQWLADLLTDNAALRQELALTTAALVEARALLTGDTTHGK